MKQETVANIHPRKVFQYYDEQETIVKPLYDHGCMEEYRIEPGLAARTWDCTFDEPTELYEELLMPGADCVLAFFPDDVCLKFGQGTRSWNKTPAWNTVFARRCQVRLFLSPGVRYRCMSIHFSSGWLRNNKARIGELLQKLDPGGKGMVVIDSIDRNDMEQVCELLDSTWKITMGILYIKSLAFHLLSDFFEKIRQDGTIKPLSHKGNDVVTAIEQMVMDHVDDRLPTLKDLASYFCTSESSLKRRFFEKHGETISAYFLKKKMVYASFLIEQRGYTLAETAHMIGYKSTNHFQMKYKRYCNKKTAAGLM